MSTPKKQYDVQLLDSNEKPTETPANNVTNGVTWNEFDYKQFQNAPKITFTGLVLIILCPVLVCAHIKVCNIVGIPMVQFLFVTTLFAFLINYTMIIRRYELMPFLPDPLYDSKLKRMCVFAVGGLIISMIWGWNGSGGILFAMGWQSVRGNRFGFYGYMLIIIVVGSLLMQENFNWKKLIEFIPGTLFGSINAQLFTLRDSSFYAIGHQFLLLAAIITPIMFPAFHIIVPSILQWIIMIVGGITVLFTTLCSIKLMQNERVSVVMGVMSGIMMIGTCDFSSHLDYIGAAIILVGGALIIKKEYIDVAI